MEFLGALPCVELHGMGWMMGLLAVRHIWTLAGGSDWIPTPDAWMTHEIVCMYLGTQGTVVSNPFPTSSRLMEAGEGRDCHPPMLP